MATPVLDKNGKTYGIRIDVNFPGEKRIQKYKGGFKTKNQAIAWSEKNKAKQDKFVNENVSFFDFIEYFLNVKKAQGIAPRSMYDYITYIELFKKEIGNPLLKNIRTVHLQEIVNKYSNLPSKCKHICQYLSAIFTIASSQSFIENNIFLKVIKPKFINNETKFYNKEQLIELLKELKIYNLKVYTHVYLIAVTGVRPSEALALTWNDLDLINKNISINKTVSIVDGKEYILLPKTVKSKREIPIFDQAIEEIKTYQKTNHIESDYICCDEKGKKLKLHCTENAIKTICKKYNFPPITPYGFRHTFGQINKNLGVDVYTVSRLMGHSNISTTTKVYYHDDVQLNKEAIKKIEKALVQ